MKFSPALRWALAAAISTQSATAFEYPDCAEGPLANNTVCDVTASPADRAAALVKALKIEEKLQNLVDMSKGAERLGLPAYAWWSEALHGIAWSPGVSFGFGGGDYSSATSFANIITLSAAFDDDLVHQVATVISTEGRAFANAGHAGLDFWTPNINPFKDPRWGRGHETPGEDPVRIKGYVKALLSGLEGDDKSVRRVVATCKHFAAYDLEGWGSVTRHDFDALVSTQDLAEYYLPPFQQCARDSNVGSIMCAYNRINGVPACANTYLMDDILRKHWNWTEHNNYITSDCQAIRDFLPGYHNTTQTDAEAAALAYNSGTDTVCEVQGYPPYTDVVGAYNETLLSEDTIDTALKRLYEGLVRVGYFDPEDGSPYRSLGWADVNTPESQALALQSAADGLVLLKNDGTLPLLDLEGKTVAIIGNWANSTNSILGGYSGTPPYIHNPIYAAKQLNLTYKYADGPLAETADDEDTWTEDALAAADEADVILYFGGTDTSIAAESLDRESIAWPAAQLTLLETLAGLGKPLVVTQLGDQVDDTPLLSNANVSAILFAGYPGQSGGTAVLDAITGRAAPAGRLPVTQYVAAYVEQVPMTDMTLRPANPLPEGDNNNNQARSASNPGRTYRWLPKDHAALPFGHGLHYTTFNPVFGDIDPASFTTADLAAGCDAAHTDLCPFPVQFPISVENTGDSVTSDYVALVFARGSYGPEPYPRKTLVGYTRIRGIKAGETGVGTVEVQIGDIARVDEKGNRVLYPGSYEFVLDVLNETNDDGEVGEGRSVTFEVTGDEVVLDEFPQPPEKK
ncbi:glycoside hydrolase family 3 protein [Chaetomium sp. MPI-SDFR-AT-0129]|nr:glycoside hydrolase family 3 protein [Chaetomium sp. MPI-SDFR-AT-0129]